MNPFTQSLSRTGFIVWSLIEICIFFVILLNLRTIRDLDELVRILIIFLVGLFGLLIVARRLQSAGLSAALSLIWLIPIVGYILWIVLCFLPTKSNSTDKR